MSGSLETFISELSKLEQTVADEAVARGLPRLRVYPLRLMNQEFPAIYNWVSTSPAEWKDVSGHRHRDIVNLSVRVAVGRIDSDELTSRLVRYSDVVRDIFDPAFRAPQPLNNACKWADRPSMTFVSEQFGDATSFPAVEFQVQAWIDRNLTPNP